MAPLRRDATSRLCGIVAGRYGRTFLMTGNKVYNMQSAGIVQLADVGAPCRYSVPDHRRWLCPPIRSIRILLEAGGLDR